VDVQAYPDTPIGFFTVYHHDLAAAVAEMRRVIEEDRRPKGRAMMEAPEKIWAYGDVDGHWWDTPPADGRTNVGHVYILEAEHERVKTQRDGLLEFARAVRDKDSQHIPLVIQSLAAAAVAACENDQ